MKFRVKTALCITMLLALAFALGGSMLISASFRSTLENEKVTALQSYKLVQSTLYIANSISKQTDYEDVASTLTQLDTQGSALWSGIKLSDREKDIYSSGIMPFSSSASTSEYDGATCYTRLSYDGSRNYLQISGIVNVNSESLYLDMSYDITSIYTIRDTQISIYQKMLVAVIVIGAVMSWIISWLLTRPLNHLSRVSRKIANGELSARANIHSGDEFQQLADDFNNMTDQLEANIEELKNTMRNQEEFMGSFAHELKTPMTSIIGYADLLRSRSLSEGEQQEAANYIFSESRRLESLSLKLLDLLVLKKQDFELLRVSPAVLISGIVRILKPVMAKFHIVLQCKCQEGYCMMEPDLVKSLIINLIDNSRKAIEGSGNIYLMSTMTETGCKIQMVDNGRGIPQDELSRITEAFYRVDKSRSRAQGGVGLGLALCDAIAKLHGGDIKFESTVGKGTIITVQLNGGRA